VATRRSHAFLVEIQPRSDSEELLVTEPVDSPRLEKHSFRLHYNIPKPPASNGSAKSARTFLALKIYSSFHLKVRKTCEDHA